MAWAARVVDDLALGVITAPRAVETLSTTLGELRRAGFGGHIHVFAEPGSALARPGDEVSVHVAPARLGAWRNWRRAAASLARFSSAPWLMVCEDDLWLNIDAAAALRQARAALPRGDWGYASLYTPWRNVRGLTVNDGWQALDIPRFTWGALAYCFTRESLADTLRVTPGDDDPGRWDADIVVSDAQRLLGRKCYFHLPSLCDHAGANLSTLGHRHTSENAGVGFSRGASARFAPAASSPGLSSPEKEASAAAVPAAPRFGMLNREAIGAGAHRSGWPRVVARLRSFAGDDGPLLDDFVEQSFAYTHRPPTHAAPWAGIFHHPPPHEYPAWHDPRQRLDAILARPEFRRSRPWLRLAVCLASNTAAYLRQALPEVRVVVLRHPHERDAPLWRPASAQRLLAQVGVYLRNTRLIYQTPKTPGWSKLRLLGRAPWQLEYDAQVARAFAGRRREVDHDVADLDRLDNARYDELLARGVVVMEPLAAAANNVTLECLARDTPLIVRRLPAVEEYLGPGYPLYFDDWREIPGLLEPRWLRAGHEYLSALDKTWLDAGVFADQLFAELAAISAGSAPAEATPPSLSRVAH